MGTRLRKIWESSTVHPFRSGSLGQSGSTLRPHPRLRLLGDEATAQTQILPLAKIVTITVAKMEKQARSSRQEGVNGGNDVMFVKNQ